MNDYSAFLVLIVIVSAGLLLGRIKIKGISLDLSAVLFVALLFGHWGLQVSAIFQTMGLCLFIYAVGVQAGPGFFDSFGKQTLKHILLAVLLVVVAALTAWVCFLIYDIDMSMAVGLLTGALTSTPGLAAAIEASQNPALASIGYGIAYPFGVIGVILFVYLVPIFFRVNVKKEEQDYQQEVIEQHPQIMHRHFMVNNKNIFGKTIAELNIRTLTGATISRVHHEGVTTFPTTKTVLQKSDLVRGVGTAHDLENLKFLIGPVTTQDIPISKKSEARWFLVTNKKVVNRTLEQLNLFETFSATVARIRRAGIDFGANLHSQIRFGDKLLIVCTGHYEELTDLFGNEDKKLLETDILPIAIGLLMGLLLGDIAIPFFGGMTFKLGITGGVLFSALVLSRLGKLGPFVWNSAGPANQFMKQFGLILFLAAVGTKAGADLMATVTTHGYRLFVMGLCITLIPMLVTTLVARLIFKINFLTILGLLTGGMTSSPGLSTVDAITESNAPSVAYALVYPVAMVLMVVFAQLLCHW